MCGHYGYIVLKGRPAGARAPARSPARSPVRLSTIDANKRGRDRLGKREKSLTIPYENTLKRTSRRTRISSLPSLLRPTCFFIAEYYVHLDIRISFSSFRCLRGLKSVPWRRLCRLHRSWSRWSSSSGRRRRKRDGYRREPGRRRDRQSSLCTYVCIFTEFPVPSNGRVTFFTFSPSSRGEAVLAPLSSVSSVRVYRRSHGDVLTAGFSRTMYHASIVRSPVFVYFYLNCFFFHSSSSTLL